MLLHNPAIPGRVMLHIPITPGYEVPPASGSKIYVPENHLPTTTQAHLVEAIVVLVPIYALETLVEAQKQS